MILMNKTKQISKKATMENNIVITNQSNSPKTKEINGPKGLEPTRYGDWEKKGRCIDF